MAKKIALSLLGLLAGPLFIVVTLPFYNWSATGGLLTALVVSLSVVASIWKKSPTGERDK